MTSRPLSDLDLGGIRVVATDLDGTLLNGDHTVSDRTRELIAAALAAGIRIVFVTGRPPRWMRAVADTTRHTGVAVCANGAVVLDLTDETITAMHPIAPADLVRAADAVRAVMGADVLIAAEQAPLGPLDGSRLIHQPDFIPTELQIRLGHQFQSEPVSDLLRQPAVVKLLARGSGPVEGTDAAVRAVHAAAGDRVTVTHSSKTHQLLEIAPAGVTKATGLAELVSGWGLRPEQVVAVGDMPNDLPMLRWAGHGFAVASGHESLLEVVDAVVPDPEHDGVAAILEEILTQHR